MTTAFPTSSPLVGFSGRGILFTDLDGTLLDFESYRPSPAACELVVALARDGILTVPVTSKTAAEVLEIMTDLQVAPIAVVEGGAVLLHEDGSSRIMGLHRERLVAVLHELRDEGWPVRGFSDMTANEVADLTGLEHDAASRAMERSASEPFVIGPTVQAKEDDLRRRAAELGAAVTRGGRFWHLIGAGVNKGTGICAVLDTLELPYRPTTGAVGDAWNDLAMLERVDHGYFLGGRVPRSQLPERVRCIAADGPGGFVAAAGEFRTACT